MESPTAESRYEIKKEKLPATRRAKGYVLTLVSAVISMGDFAPAPATNRFRIIDRATGQTAGVVDEGTDEAVDLGAVIRADLNESTVEDFERVWLSGRRQ